VGHGKKTFGKFGLTSGLPVCTLKRCGGFPGSIGLLIDLLPLTPDGIMIYQGITMDYCFR
jgi:hypothetical protein